VTSEPDDPAKSAVTVPIRVTPKSAEPTPSTPADAPADSTPKTAAKAAGEKPRGVAPDDVTREMATVAPPPKPAVDVPSPKTSPAQPSESSSEPAEATSNELPKASSEATSDEPADRDAIPEIPPEVTARQPEPQSAVPTPRRPARTRAGGIGVAIVLVAAGFLFTTSATTARGTQFRSERANLADLIAAEDHRVKTRTQRVAALNKQVQEDVAASTVNNKAMDTLEERSASVVSAAGLQPMTGPGLTVTLDDAPRDVQVPDQAGPDDLVVHQQDVQAVVNALWAGGAEAMKLQDQRVISTSAVRCVGNTLILQGRVYSPPYTITAIGDTEKMQASLDSSPQVAYYLQYVASFRLGWSVKQSDRLALPAYAGSLALSHARVAGGTTPASSGSASSSP
jgi:uncharacterized protein YlxW (UPF0749 family)